MRVLQYALMLAVVFGAGMTTAQDRDQPKGDQLPWWKLSDDAAKDGPQVKDADKGPRDPVVKKASDEPARRTIVRDKPAPTRGGDAAADRPAGKDGDAGQQQKRFYSYYYSGPKGDAPKPQPRERLVYRLANMPSRDVANTVNELLDSERAVPGRPPSNTIVLADPVSNSLIISGTSEAIHETVKLVEQLDREPSMVCVQVVIGLVESREGLSLLGPNADGPELSCSHAEACELIEEFSKSDAVKILARPQLMTLDSQPAFLQMGQRVPRVTVRNSKDGQLIGTDLENVGLIVGLTPRVSPDHVVTMELDIEKSEVGPVDEGIPIGVDAKGNVLRSPRVDNIVIQTTVKIPPSRAVIIGGMALQDGDDRGELVMVVTPHVVQQRK